MKKGLVFGCNIRNRNELHFCEFADNLWQWSFIFHCLPRSLGPVIYDALANSRCTHTLPGNLIARLTSQSCGWGISKLCVAQMSGIWQPQGHSRAFGMHMHSFLDITKRGGFYWRQQQIFRLTHLSWFYARISPLYNQARSQELLSWTDNFLVMERNFCWSRIWL